MNFDDTITKLISDLSELQYSCDKITRIFVEDNKKISVKSHFQAYLYPQTYNDKKDFTEWIHSPSHIYEKYLTQFENIILGSPQIRQNPVLCSTEYWSMKTNPHPLSHRIYDGFIEYVLQAGFLARTGIYQVPLPCLPIFASIVRELNCKPTKSPQQIIEDIIYTTYTIIYIIDPGCSNSLLLSYNKIHLFIYNIRLLNLLIIYNAQLTYENIAVDNNINNHFFTDPNIVQLLNPLYIWSRDNFFYFIVKQFYIDTANRIQKDIKKISNLDSLYELTENYFFKQEKCYFAYFSSNDNSIVTLIHKYFDVRWNDVKSIIMLIDGLENHTQLRNFGERIDVYKTKTSDSKLISIANTLYKKLKSISDCREDIFIVNEKTFITICKNAILAVFSQADQMLEQCVDILKGSDGIKDKTKKLKELCKKNNSLQEKPPFLD